MWGTVQGNVNSNKTEQNKTWKDMYNLVKKGRHRYKYG